MTASANKTSWVNLDNWGRPFHRIPESFSWDKVNHVRDLTPLFALNFLPEKNYELMRKKACAFFLTASAIVFLAFGLFTAGSLYTVTQNIHVFRIGIAAGVISQICFGMALLYGGTYHSAINAEVSPDQKIKFKESLNKEFAFVDRTIETFAEVLGSHKAKLPELKERLTNQGAL